MGVANRLRHLDDRVGQAATRRFPPSPAREQWGKRYAWTLMLGLSLVLLAFSAWALATDRPAAVGFPMALGLGFLGAAVYLFVNRERQARKPGPKADR